MDNTSTIQLAQNHVYYGRGLHIKADHYLVDEKVERGVLVCEALSHLRAGCQRVDLRAT